MNATYHTQGNEWIFYIGLGLALLSVVNVVLFARSFKRDAWDSWREWCEREEECRKGQ